MNRETLIRRAQQGDRQAFAGLFEQTKNLVFKTAYLLLDERAEAEDALQEVFLQVWRALPAYQPERGAFTTWLHRITVNHCLNRQRARRSLSWSVAQVDQHIPEADPSPEGHLVEQEWLVQSLQQLSPPLRTVIILRYAEELSYREIADVLELPIGTVKSRLHAALQQLRAAGAEAGAVANHRGFPDQEVEP